MSQSLIYWHWCNSQVRSRCGQTLGGDACHVEDLREVHLHWYRGLLRIWQNEFLLNSVNVCIFFIIFYTKWFEVTFLSPSWTIPKRSLWITWYVTFDTSMHLKLVALRNLASCFFELDWRQENCPKPQRSNSEPTLSTLKDKLSQSFKSHFNHLHRGHSWSLPHCTMFHLSNCINCRMTPLTQYGVV